MRRPSATGRGMVVVSDLYERATGAGTVRGVGRDRGAVVDPQRSEEGTRGDVGS